jgi:hypothetical protein
VVLSHGSYPADGRRPVRDGIADVRNGVRDTVDQVRGGLPVDTPALPRRDAILRGERD